MQMLASLEFVLWKIGAIVANASFPVSHTAEHFDEQGNPLDPATLEPRAQKFLEAIEYTVKSGQGRGE